MTEEPIKILVVDDHPLFRKGVIHMLQSEADMEIIGEAGDGETALDMTRELMPDVILMDVSMPGWDGIKATRRIMEEFPSARIVMLTVNDDDRSLFNAIKAGARGYLFKNLEPEDLLKMVRGIFRGEAPISRITANRILKEFGRLSRHETKPSISDLSSREQEILKLVANGDSNKEIARALIITEYTVKNHLRNILEKLHVRNRVEAAIIAVREGLVENGF